MNVTRTSLADALGEHLPGWTWRLSLGRQSWHEPRTARYVLIDQRPGDATAIVEAHNGAELIVLRCTPSTPTALVVDTLTRWRMLPAADGQETRQ